MFAHHAALLLYEEGFTIEGSRAPPISRKRLKPAKSQNALPFRKTKNPDVNGLKEVACGVEVRY